MTSQLDAITPDLLREHPLPAPGDSKSSRGTALVIGGAVGTPGAVMLAGLAALRVGAGVLTVAVPRSVAVALAVAVPEAGVSSWDDSSGRPTDFAAVTERIAAADSVLVGPGLDDPEFTRRVVDVTLDDLPADVPIVLDAFALGVLPDLADRVTALDGRVVLTPNHTEAARLLDSEPDAIKATDDDQVATKLADRWSATVIYQGIVATAGGDAATVGTGHGGLGTSGSGDVLAGAVAGVLARGADVHPAACWAAYLHAAAGDRLAAQVGKVGFLARELLGELPRVMSEVSG
jgi:ADP-dependent NAD(P)H-hydrate dehydratase